MKIRFEHQKNEVSLEIRKINTFYGYSSSGKTMLAKTLNEGLSGKNKSFTINNYPVIKEENKVVFINSEESLIDHLKLSSKSLIRQLYHNKLIEYFNTNSNIITQINASFEEVNSLLTSITESFNYKTSFAKMNLKMSVDSVDELIDNFVDVSFDVDNLSSSSSKEILFYLISSLNSSTQKPVYIIIDDFDSLFDEELTLKFYKFIKDFNFTFFLFTNKANSLPYNLDINGVFSVRENKIINFSNFLYLIKKSLLNNETIENHTFEEYMTNFGYFETSGVLEDVVQKIKINSIYNFGRMLTNKAFTITDTIDLDQICIIPTTKEEKTFLMMTKDYLTNQ